MGRDKAIISLDGVPLIRRIYDAVVNCQDDSGGLEYRIHVTAPWIDRYQPLLSDSCQFLTELEPHQGPLIGFAQSLPHISSEWVLLLACDLPNLSTPIIQDWISGLANLPHQSMAYLPRNPAGKGWEPLCGFYRRECLTSLLAQIEAGGRSFQGWLVNCNVTELPIADRRWLLNCNTPADLAAVIADRSHSIPTGESLPSADSSEPKGLKY